MKKFIQTIKNIFSIEDLRIRIINTLGFLLIFRLGSYIVLPGVDPTMVSRGGDQNRILGFLDTVVGGAFSNVSIFVLGIMPKMETLLNAPPTSVSNKPRMLF